MSRRLVFAAGLAGAAGVALSAAAAHRGGTNLATAAAMLLAHAPALLAIGLNGAAHSSRLVSLAAAALISGLILFCGDLASREFIGDRLFPMAAPAGGMLLIGGWLFIAFSALVAARKD